MHRCCSPALMIPHCAASMPGYIAAQTQQVHAQHVPELRGGSQALPAWSLVGIYTGEVQLSDDVEQIFKSTERGIGYLLYDKREALCYTSDTISASFTFAHLLAGALLAALLCYEKSEVKLHAMPCMSTVTCPVTFTGTPHRCGLGFDT